MTGPTLLLATHDDALAAAVTDTVWTVAEGGVQVSMHEVADIGP